MPNSEKPFDLEERTALFGEMVVEFAKSVLPHDAPHLRQDLPKHPYLIT